MQSLYRLPITYTLHGYNIIRKHQLISVMNVDTGCLLHNIIIAPTCKTFNSEILFTDGP